MWIVIPDQHLCHYSRLCPGIEDWIENSSTEMRIQSHGYYLIPEFSFLNNTVQITYLEDPSHQVENSRNYCITAWKY